MKHNGFYYYKIDVMGRNGYSFMVKSKTELGDMYDAIDIASRNELFSDEYDADYAEVDDLVSEDDINNFEKCGCAYEI